MAVGASRLDGILTSPPGRWRMLLLFVPAIRLGRLFPAVRNCGCRLCVPALNLLRTAQRYTPSVL